MKGVVLGKALSINVPLLATHVISQGMIVVQVLLYYLCTVHVKHMSQTKMAHDHPVNVVENAKIYGRLLDNQNTNKSAYNFSN